ncbi:hypothetical protein HY486_01240 [Candidatus Woesearchaeota archaeon]|nr:hypothetical protein [Candidatus Woesearchaeota archaeon]
MYEYLLWTAILGIIWLAAFISIPRLRKKILFSSLIALPFGFGELYYIPNYWRPQTLFNLGTKYHITIEAFILMFFLGGTAAAIYESITKKRTLTKTCNNTCNTPLLTTLAALLLLIKSFPETNIIYLTIIALLAGGTAAFFIYPNLRQHIIIGGLLFAFFYWSTLTISEIISPWITTTWIMKDLTGIMLGTVPLEEILFGFAFGTLWSPLYEEACASKKNKESTYSKIINKTHKPRICA